jgi:hypothetical protein
MSRNGRGQDHKRVEPINQSRVHGFNNRLVAGFLLLNHILFLSSLEAYPTICKRGANNLIQSYGSPHSRLAISFGDGNLVARADERVKRIWALQPDLLPDVCYEVKTLHRSMQYPTQRMHDAAFDGCLMLPLWGSHPGSSIISAFCAFW